VLRWQERLFFFFTQHICLWSARRKGRGWGGIIRYCAAEQELTRRAAAAGADTSEQSSHKVVGETGGPEWG
jgi:hypothetical protein